MKQPNRIKIIMDGGTAEIYGDIFADMLTVYYLAMTDRQKKAQTELAEIRLGDEYRTEKFKAACFNYDDAASRKEIAGQIERVFKHGRNVVDAREPCSQISYVQLQRGTV